MFNKFKATASALILSLMPLIAWWGYTLGGFIPALIAVFTVVFPIGLMGVSTSETRVQLAIGAVAFPAMLWMFWSAVNAAPEENALAWGTSVSIIFIAFAYITAISMIQKGD